MHLRGLTYSGASSRAIISGNSDRVIAMNEGISVRVCSVHAPVELSRLFQDDLDFLYKTSESCFCYSND